VKTLQIARRFTRRAWGGTETVVLETSRRLTALGHDAQILCANALDPVPEEAIDGVRVRRFPYIYPYVGLSAENRAQLDRVGGNLFSLPMLRALLAEPGVDLMHLHTGKRLGGIVRTAARLRGVPYVVSLHGGLHDVPGREVERLLEPTEGTIEWGRALGWAVGSRRVLADAGAILCVGERERRETQKLYPQVPVLHLPNGVHARRFAGGDGARFRARLGMRASDELLLVVGRIDPQKNQCLAVEVTAALAAERPGLHLALVGPVTSPAYRGLIERTAERLGVSGRVHVVEGLPAGSRELAGAYHAADLMLLPSIHEPFGIVILEAWAAGRAVVASNVGGVPSVVRNGSDGVLLPPTDVRAWVQTVRELLESPALRSGLGDAGRHKAIVQYGWDRITDRLVQIYDSVRRGRLRRRAA
jgi:glycosyltransferase involved in cell wall biosynthesis